MSLESQIATLTEKMDALIGAIAANTHILNHPILVADPASPVAASSSSATTASPAPAVEKSEPKRRGRPPKKQTQATPAPVVEEELPRQDGLFDEAEEEGITREEMREAVFALRNLAMKKLGKEDGLEYTRKVMVKYANHIDHVLPKDYDDLYHDSIGAAAKL